MSNLPLLSPFFVRPGTPCPEHGGILVGYRVIEGKDKALFIPGGPENRPA